MSQRGSLRLGLAVCAVVAACTAGSVSPAFGVYAHYYAGLSFGAPGAGAGELSLLAAGQPSNGHSAAGSGVAVSELSHDVYVADTGNSRVDVFEADGAFVRAFGWGVEDGEAKLEACTSLSGCRAGLSGSGPGEFERPVFVAVDNDPASPSYGDVYVADTEDNLVTKFTGEGVLVGSWGNNGSGGSANGQLNGSPTEVFNKGESGLPLGGIAVDGAGNLWAVDRTGRLFEFGQADGFAEACTTHIGGVGAWGMSVDGSGGVYVTKGSGEVEEIRAGCGSLGQVTPIASNEATGLVVDSVSRDLYVDHAGLLIEDIPLSGCVPNEDGCVASQLFGEGVLGAAAGLAVDSASGMVFAANTSADQIVVFDIAVAGTVGSASEVLAHSAVLHGTADPEGAELSECRFEYATEQAYSVEHVYSNSVPCEQSLGSIGAGSAPVEVGAKIEALAGASTYDYRLHAKNKNGSVYSESGSLSTLPVARIEQAASGEIKPEEAGGGVSAVVSASVTPLAGSSTSCEIEYGASTAYGSTAPCEPASLAGASAVPVSVRLVGLAGGVTYHWRLVASNTNGAEYSSDQTFVYLTGALVQSGCPNEALRGESDQNLTTGASFSLALPDCRAYEMVTPPSKDGALIDNGAFLTPPSLASDGSRVLAKSIQCFQGPPSCVGVRQSEGEPYAFERTATGWETSSLAPPVGAGNTMLTYSAETDMALYGIAAAAGAQEQLYAREPDGELRAIGPISEAPGEIVRALASSVIAASPDLSTVVFENAHLWPSLEGGAVDKTLFEYRGTGNRAPSLVAVSDPAGKSLIGACGALLGGRGLTTLGALSKDAQTVFFTVKPCRRGTGENVGKPVPTFDIYARVTQSGGPTTVHVSAPGPEAVCHATCQNQPPADAAFQGASSDGSRVYFTSTGQLTDSASEDKHNGDSAAMGCANVLSTATGCNLYEFECPNHCEVASERRLVDVSAGDVSGLGPRVQGVIAISQDGSTVYFVARGVLTGSNGAGVSPVPDAENLYVYRAGHVAFVATLSTSDAWLWLTDEGLGKANVTPDGRYLLFTSHKALTVDTTRPEGPAQVYRYDAQTETLTRVSIGRDGFGDNGNASGGNAAIVPADASLNIGQGQGRTDPSMSDNGQFVFFESPAGLVPGALNNQHVIDNPKTLAENVYEWVASGAHTSVGTACEAAAGCVSLISDGKDLAEGTGAHRNLSATQLLGTDSTGENAFFWTADQLVPSDTDTQIDLYDARVGGGFPELAPPACEPGLTLSGGACRSAGSAPGLFGGPVSVTFSGPGNAISETGSGGKPTPRGLTRAQKLKRALTACRGRYRSMRARGKRVLCERQARQRYRTSTTVGGGRRHKAASRGRKSR